MGRTSLTHDVISILKGDVKAAARASGRAARKVSSTVKKAAPRIVDATKGSASQAWKAGLVGPRLRGPVGKAVLPNASKHRPVKIPRTTRAALGAAAVSGVTVGLAKGVTGTAKDQLNTLGVPSGFAADYSINQTFENNRNTRNKRLQNSTMGLTNSLGPRSSGMRSIRSRP